MKLLHGVRSKVNQTELKMAYQSFVQGPKMDWTEDPDLHRCFGYVFDIHTMLWYQCK